MKVKDFAIQFPAIRASLFIFPSNKNAELFIVPDAESYGESKYQLKESCTYEYEFESWEGNNNTYQFADESEIVQFSRSKHNNRGLLRTGIYVGTLTLYIRSNSTNELVGTVDLEVQSVKASYRSDYRTMLEDITRYYTDLVMLQGSPSTRTFMVDEKNTSQTLYQKFTFVRSVVDSRNFQEAIHKIQSNPVRRWMETQHEVSIYNIKKLSRDGLKQIASRTNRIKVNDEDSFGNSFSLRSLPTTIVVPYKKDSVDNIENQFVKFVLQTFHSFCSYIQTLKKANSRLKQEANTTCNKLSGILSSSFFKEVSLPTHFNLNSPVLQRKEGYREVLQAWIMFDMAAKLCWQGGEDVYKIGMKNVATLYEYWLFFKLLELISSIFDIPKAEKEKLVSIGENQINLNLREGYVSMVKGIYVTDNRKINIRFYYNRTFGSTHEMSEAGSWTTTMRPDYTLSLWPGEGITEEEAEKENMIIHVHFDAKYRLDKILLDDNAQDDEKLSKELTEEKKEQALGIYKKADLLKMHAYKDAIRRTSGAYVLYPGDVHDNLPPKKGFHEIIPGLGAFCISPGNVQSEIGALKEFILKIVDHLLNRASQRERLSFYDYTIHKDIPSSNDIFKENLPETYGNNRGLIPDETYVLLGYYKNNDHLEWIIKNQLYNSRAGFRNGTVAISQTIASAKYILLHNNKQATLLKLTDTGPLVFGYQDMLKLSYPFNSKEEEDNKKNIYLMFRLNQKGIESEFKKYMWNPQAIPHLNGKNMTRLHCIKLTELIRYAIIL